MIEVAKVGFGEKIQNVTVDTKDGHGGGDEVLRASLADTMLRGKPPRTSIREGLFSAVTSLGIDKAMDTGRVVNMAPLWKQAGVDPSQSYEDQMQ